MFLKAKEDFNIEMNESWLIGDSHSDIITGKKAECKTILINTEFNNSIFFEK